MNTFLRRRVNGKPLHPHTPVTLEAARLTFTPQPNARRGLPQEHAETRCDHDKEQDLHPRRDVAEDFPCCVIYVRHGRCEHSLLLNLGESDLSTPRLAAIMTKNKICIHGAMLPKTSRVALSTSVMAGASTAYCSTSANPI